MDKYSQLLDLLRGLESAILAYSGGVDSTLLLKAGATALGDRFLPVIGRSCSLPQRELLQARAMAGHVGVRLEEVEVGEMSDPQYLANPVDRCFHCKQHLFGILTRMAATRGYARVLDGANRDDLGDYRPGIEAATKLGVRHPLIEVGMGKLEIRASLRCLGIPVWDRPAAACLASRVPFGMPITEAKLRRIEKAEDLLLGMGFGVVRVRDFDHLAVIEVGSDEVARLLSDGVRQQVALAVESVGYRRVAMDVRGYSMGSLNP
jgi:uncharacterized protein